MSRAAELATWRNRIVGHGEEAPDQLLANPKNWRIHPQAQQEALAGVLDEVGWVGHVTVNKQTGFVVDGHLRVALAISRAETAVPVSYVDLTPEEEALVLMTLDPIGGMAAGDRAQVAALMDEVTTGSEAVQRLLAQVAEGYGVIPPDFQAVGADTQPRLDEKARVTCPECGCEFAP